MYSEKFYNESVETINIKINNHSKKILNTENNILNKYRLIKEKVLTINKPNSDTDKKLIELKNLKERNLILENKVKNFDDILASLKNKLNEKDEIIKSFSDNIEKNKNKIKDLKDENAKLKIKELNEVKDQNTNKNNIIQECKKNADNEQILKKESKMKKNDNSSELNKTNIAEINNLLTTSLISGTIIFPNYHLLSIFSLQLAKNPLNLVNKSHISYIYIAKNIGILLNDILKNKNQDLLTNFKSSFISTINRDYKKNLSDFVYSNEEIIINNPFINLIEVSEKKLNFNLIFYQKLAYILNYFNKNEVKLTEKYNKGMCKIIQFCMKFLMLSFTSRDYILEFFSSIKNFIITNDQEDLFTIMKEVNVLEILILLIESNEEFFQFLEIFLFFFMKNHNLSYLNEYYSNNKLV